MAEGLDFLIDLDMKTDAAKNGSKVLDEILAMLKQTDSALNKVDHASEKAAGGHNKHAAAAKHAEGVIHHFTHAVLGPFIERAERIAEFEFIRNGIDFLLEIPGEAIELFKEMVNVAAQTERTNKSFGLLFGEREGKETLEWIEGIAKFTEFTDDELKGMAQSLAKVGFEGEGLTRALAASLDISAFSKTGEAGASEALSSLERIKRTGHVDNRALGGLGIGEDAFLAEMSKRTGEGTATLKKKMSEGKIAAEESLETLYAMIAAKTGKALGGAGVEMSTTLMARLKHLKDIPEQIFQKLAGTDGFAKINEFVGRLLVAFDPDGAVGGSISETLNKVFDQIGEKLDGIDVEGIVRNIPPAIEAVTSTLNTLWEALKPIVDGFKAVAGFVEFVNEKTGTGSFSKQAATNAANRAENPELWAERDRLLKKRSDMLAAKSAGQTYYDMDKPMYGPQEAYADKAARMAAEAHRKIGAATGAGMKVGVEGSTPSVTKATDMQASATERAMMEGLGVHSPSKVFEHIGMMTGEGFNDGIVKSMANTDSVMRGAFALPAPGAVASSSRAGGPIQVTVEVGGVHVNGAGGDGAEIARQISEQLRVRLPGEMQSAFERIGVQAGAS